MLTLQKKQIKETNKSTLTFRNANDSSSLQVHFAKDVHILWRPKKDMRIVSAMTLFIKAIVLLLFLFIFFSLASALYYLVTDKSGSNRVVKALTWRIGLSIVLFILLMIAFAFGWLTPHPVGG
jgi:hypothetical protein